MCGLAKGLLASSAPSREVLGRAEIAPLVKGQELGPLLPPETQLRLEEACIAAVQVTPSGQW